MANSDRCTYWLHSAEERHSMYLARQRKYAREALILVAELVISAVHPGNLGVLPPSPSMLCAKARQIGILNDGEYIKYETELV